MFSNKTNSSLWPCLHLIHLIPFTSWDFECILCRLGGIIILCMSIICFIFIIRYLIWYHQERCRNTLVLSLFIASFLVLIISVPSVVLQLFTCHRHCNEIYCRIEGFVSYFAGCLCMLIYMISSINRYLLLRHYDHPLFHRYSMIISWSFCLTWTFPPVFNFWISYVPEGLGFHCSLNWNNHSKSSFYYIFCSFLGIYFVPLIILLLVNFRVHQMLRNIYTTQSLYHINEDISDEKSLSSFKRRLHRQLDNRSNIAFCYIRKAADRKRLRIDYRFVQANLFLVSAYIFAWTPYAIIALLQLFHMDFIGEHTLLITLSAIIGKLAVILAPVVYVNVMNFRLFKKLCFCS